MFDKKEGQAKFVTSGKVALFHVRKLRTERPTHPGDLGVLSFGVPTLFPGGLKEQWDSTEGWISHHHGVWNPGQMATSFMPRDLSNFI